MNIRIIATILLFSAMSFAQSEANYDETKVPKFTLPDALVTFSGNHISDHVQWEADRRFEIFQFFERQVYGKVPGRLDEYSFKLIEEIEKIGVDNFLYFWVKKTNKSHIFS